MVTVHVTAVDMAPKLKIPKVRLVIRGEHPGVDRGGQPLALAPAPSGVSSGLTGLTQADERKLP